MGAGGGGQKGGRASGRAGDRMSLPACAAPPPTIYYRDTIPGAAASQQLPQPTSCQRVQPGTLVRGHRLHQAAPACSGDSMAGIALAGITHPGQDANAAAMSRACPAVHAAPTAAAPTGLQHAQQCQLCCNAIMGVDQSHTATEGGGGGRRRRGAQRCSQHLTRVGCWWPVDGNRGAVGSHWVAGRGLEGITLLAALHLCGPYQAFWADSLLLWRRSAQQPGRPATALASAAQRLGE